MLLSPKDPQEIIDKCIAIANKYSLDYGYNLLYNSNGEILLLLSTEKVLYAPFYHKNTKIKPIWKGIE